MDTVPVFVPDPEYNENNFITDSLKNVCDIWAASFI